MGRFESENGSIRALVIYSAGSNGDADERTGAPESCECRLEEQEENGEEGGGLDITLVTWWYGCPTPRQYCASSPYRVGPSYFVCVEVSTTMRATRVPARGEALGIR